MLLSVNIPFQKYLNCIYVIYYTNGSLTHSDKKSESFRSVKTTFEFYAFTGFHLSENLCKSEKCFPFKIS